ncbi:RNA polymerase sigma factor SigD [Phycisphaerae bacterium RAS1]|nr:RNA polymerase sigma factor SigD [Phycisphaerae bacterium RAS1]
MAGGDGTVTQLLKAAATGNRAAVDRLWSVVYDELCRIAQERLRAERRRCTIGTNSLVHEACARLIGKRPVRWDGRAHFFGAARTAMRRILVEQARRQRRIKRGEGAQPVPLVHEVETFDHDPTEVLAVDEALERLATAAPRQAEIVEYRYFAGLGVDETAEVMGVSSGVIDKDWRFARAWLHRELSKGDTRTRETRRTPVGARPAVRKGGPRKSRA